MDNEKNLSIGFIIDDRISNDKIAVLTRAIHGLRQTFQMHLIKGHEITEPDLIQRIQNGGFHLILAPLHRYQSWGRVEGALGINRTSGPTFAGYFCEPTTPKQIGEIVGQNRKIILDFVSLNSNEILTLVRSLIQDTRRAGLRSLLDPQALVYCESWYGGQGNGNRMDQVLALPEIRNTEWMKRSSAIRIIMSSLWSLVYEEGPGKVDTATVTGNRTPKAYFQIAADSNILLFRLYYYTVPHLSPKEMVKQFSLNLDHSNPTKSSQLLLKYADFVRVHSIHETSDIEVVIGLFRSAPAEQNYQQAHTIWIEPLSARLVLEHPYEVPGPSVPYLRLLPPPQVIDNKPRLVSSTSPTDSSLDEVLLDATSKIKELNQKVLEREKTISDLKSGGIGTAAPLPPADAEGLLEAFQNRFMDARFQMRQFELQIADMEKHGATPQEMETLNLKMEALANRERAWIKKLMGTLEVYKEAKKKIKGST